MHISPISHAGSHILKYSVATDMLADSYVNLITVLV